MAKSKQVMVELNDTNHKAIRIIKGDYTRYCYHSMDYTKAVKEIREQVYERTKDRQGNHCCEYCGDIITEHFHLHERTPRGKGGEISIFNCVGLCAECHIGKAGEHQNRRVRFGERQE